MIRHVPTGDPTLDDPQTAAHATFEMLEPRQLLSAAALFADTGTCATPTTTAVTTQSPALATAAAASSTGRATKATSGGTTAAARRDALFLQNTESADLLEIQLGNTAQTNASNAAVKSFGARMVTDHTQLLQQLRQVATANGVTLTGTLSKKDQRDFNRLSRLTGTKFDRAYSTFMVADHKKDVRDVTVENKRTTNASIKTLTAQALPILQAHLTLAQTTRRDVFATKATTTSASLFGTTPILG